jgi:hypothetical protein
MYSFGSVSAVGSWFCISVTNSVRKSLAEIVESLLESSELSLPLVPVVPFVPLVPPLPLVEPAIGVASIPFSACPAVIM